MSNNNNKNKNDKNAESESGSGMVDSILCVLPEGCIAHAVSMTSPRDACRLSVVASTFRSAAESDAVWERFLPSDYQDTIARSVVDHDETCRTTSLAFNSKKELYLHLCNNPLIIDGGTKSFSLEKWSGKKCYMLAARNLSVVWGDTPRYWKWTSLPESRFAEVAELISVCWLEIHGKIDTGMLSPDTIYAAYLVFKSTPGAYGLETHPAGVSIGISGVESETRSAYLDPDGGERHRYQTVPRRFGLFNQHTANIVRPEVNVPRETDSQLPKQRGDGWLEIELGEYDNSGETDGELEMSLKEVNGGNWKSGLIVQGIEIRPKGGR